MTNNYRRIPIKTKGKIIYFLIDVEDFQKIEGYSWFVKNNNYVYTQINRKTIHLHRLILNLKNPKIQIDHINNNPLDNRKSNLRKATRSQNNINKSNLFSGVSKFKEKWRARIKILGKEIHIGIYETKKEALKARIKVENKLFKNFSKHLKK